MIVLDDVAGLPLFAGCPSDALSHALASGADVRVNANEYLVHEGEVCGFSVLLEGKLELTKRAGKIERLIAIRETPGDHFGEVPLLISSPALVDVRAVVASRLLSLDATRFRALFAAAPAFAARMIASASERLAGVSQMVIEPEPAAVVVVGRCFEAESHRVRDFLARSHVPFDFLSFDCPSTAGAIGEYAVPDREGPFVFLGRKTEPLVRPSMRELAEAAGQHVRASDADYDVAIVGGGPAGLAAAVYGASEGLRTALFEREAPGGQAGTSSRIENYLGFPTGLSGDDLASRAVAQATRFGAELIVTREVTGIEPGDGAHRVLLDGGDAIVARAVVIASGVSWRMLDVEGLNRYVGAGVYYGAARTEAAAVRGKDVYLVGGGNSAGQAAMFFANYARTVTLVVRGAALAQSMSDYLIKQLDAKANIRVETRSEVVAAYGSSRLEALDIVDRASGRVTHREAVAVFVFIGADATTGWLPASIGRDARGYVTTGTAVRAATGERPAWSLTRDPYFLETSVPGVFAAGDVRADSIKRCAAGVGEGSMAIALTHQYFAGL